LSSALARDPRWVAGTAPLAGLICVIWGPGHQIAMLDFVRIRHHGSSDAIPPYMHCVTRPQNESLLVGRRCRLELLLITLKILHTTTYRFNERVSLLPHRLMLRPRESRELRLISSQITVVPDAVLTWAHDVFGNAVATAAFPSPAIFTIRTNRAWDRAMQDQPMRGRRSSYREQVGLLSTRRIAASAASI
jgi:hypothetical protein